MKLARSQLGWQNLPRRERRFARGRSAAVLAAMLRRGLHALVVLSIAIFASGSVLADPVTPPDRTEPKPKRLEGVDVDEHLNTSLPLDLGFQDENGKHVTLRDYVDGSVPVIVTLNYSNCPMLCSLVLNALVDTLKQIDWTPGKEFRIVTVSLDPTETTERAHKWKARYMAQYGRPGAEPGWHFLSGSEANIRALADAIGFHYNYNEKRAEYVHPAAFAIATPAGRIARYLYGIEYHPRTLRLSLAEASEGKIGTTVDRLVLYCFHYDENEGRYAPVARNIMRLGGAVAVVLIGAFLGALWLTEYRKKKLQQAQT